MLLLTASTLRTPLLKVPILLSNGILTYMATGVPNFSHPPAESKVVGTDLMTRTATLQIALAKVTMVLFNGLAIAEIAIILAQAFPESPLSVATLGVLTPSGGSLALRITPTFLLGVAVNTAGAAIRTWSFKTLGKFFTGKIDLHRDHELVTAGPYAFVRHPSYTGSLAIVIGNIVALLLSEGSYAAQVLTTGAWWGVLTRSAVWALMGWRVVATVYLLPSRAMDEDRLLREEFGERWEAYARRTPYRIFPYIW